ncbi:MAG: DUF2092 domain-containing protein [Planctomycetes bacterium]|nr:DUF2092 domain-containing protein [Planctomycetota bacterium]
MKRLLLGACWMVWFMGALVATAADAGKSEPAKVDPKADRALRGMTDALAKTKAFSVDVTANMTVQPVNQTNANVTSLVIDRGGKRMAAVLKSGETGATIVNDGKELTVALPMMKKYMVEPAPKSLEEPFPAILSGLLMMQGLQFVAPLWNEKPYDALIEGVTEVKYVGEEDVAGTKCDHLTFVQDPCDVQLWITKGDAPELRKISPDMTKLLQASGATLPPGITISLAVMFENWSLSPKLDDKTFVFAAPDGMEKVDSLFGRKQGPHPLKDKPAPDFSVKLLGGDELKLSKHKGKEVVVLDFWATWCGPCVQALPAIIEVTDSFKDKGVVFYAVNLQEDADTIRPFLEEKKLKPTVAMDSDGSVANSYGVEGIPQTVIIDKDGTVRVVHVGASPNLKKELTAEIEAILSGKAPANAEK